MARKIALRKVARRRVVLAPFPVEVLEINTRAKGTFRKVRELLLRSCDNGDISEG